MVLVDCGLYCSNHYRHRDSVWLSQQKRRVNFSMCVECGDYVEHCSILLDPASGLIQPLRCLFPGALYDEVIEERGGSSGRGSNLGITRFSSSPALLLQRRGVSLRSQLLALLILALAHSKQIKMNSGVLPRSFKSA